MAQIKVTERPTMLAIASVDYFGDNTQRTLTQKLYESFGNKFPESDTEEAPIPIIFKSKGEALEAISKIASLIRCNFSYKMWIMYEEKQVNIEIKTQLTFSDFVDEEDEDENS